MGRTAHIYMKILDFKVQDGKAVISVEIRKSTFEFRKAYGFAADYINKFNMDDFRARVYQDAVQLITDKEFEEAALRKINDMVGVKIALDRRDNLVGMPEE